MTARGFFTLAWILYPDHEGPHREYREVLVAEWGYTA